AAGDLRDDGWVLQVRCWLEHGRNAGPSDSRLQDPGSYEAAFAAHVADYGDLGSRGDCFGFVGVHWPVASLTYFAADVVWRPDLLGSNEALVFVQAAQAGDVATDGAQVTHSCGDIAGAGFTLGANHCSAFGDTTKRLTQVGSTTDERYVELPFVDVVGVVRWTKHLRFIDEIHAESFQHLRFNEVADACFCHHWDGNRVDDAFDQVRVAHARHATLRTDIGW